MPGRAVPSPRRRASHAWPSRPLPEAACPSCTSRRRPWPPGRPGRRFRASQTQVRRSGLRAAGCMSNLCLARTHPAFAGPRAAGSEQGCAPQARRCRERARHSRNRPSRGRPPAGRPARCRARACRSRNRPAAGRRGQPGRDESPGTRGRGGLGRTAAVGLPDRRPPEPAVDVERRTRRAGRAAGLAREPGPGAPDGPRPQGLPREPGLGAPNTRDPQACRGSLAAGPCQEAAPAGSAEGAAADPGRGRTRRVCRGSVAPTLPSGRARGTWRPPRAAARS
jgi:hypothetical protein